MIGSGSTLNVLGNVYVSNGLAAANVAPTMNANIVSTNVTYMNLFTYGLGINTPAQPIPVVGAFQGGILNGDAAPTLDAPTSNLALQFSNTSTSYVNMGTITPAHVNINTDAIFVEAWIYATQPLGTGFVNIASYGGGTTSGWSLKINQSGVRVETTSRILTNGGGSISPNQWSYIAFRTNVGDGTIYAWKASTGSTGVSSNIGGVSPLYSVSDPFYIGAVSGVGGFTTTGTLYIRDMRIISAVNFTNASNFTPEQAPFSIAPPTYASGDGVTYNWGLQASTNLYQLVPQPLVLVNGNVWCSNAFQGQGIFTNALAETSNLGSTAIKRIFSPAAGGIVGIGQVPVVGSANLQVEGNIFASNALQSSTILATTANAIFSNVNSITNSNRLVGINIASPTSNLHVSGNVVVTDYITTGIANTVRTNVDTTNVLSIEGKVGINITTVALGPTLNIFGNVYVSNAITGTIRNPRANTTTLNIASAYGTSGRVGFNVNPLATGPTLQFGTGNVYASNSISGQNVIVTTIQTYNEDLTRRSPHLRPTTANCDYILNWIAASCSTTQKVGWSVASVPTFSTATVGATGSALYSSSLLGPDGRVYFTPCNATNIGTFNPKTNEFSTIVPSGASLTGDYKYGSSVLCPNGNIAFIQNTSTTILAFNPVDKTASSGNPTLANGLNGGVLGPDGAVYCPIYTGALSAVRRYDPYTRQTTTDASGTGGFSSAALTPTGNIVGIPWTSTFVRVWDVIANSTLGILDHNQTTPAFSGSVLDPTGNVIFVPYSSANICVFSDTSNAISNVTHYCGTEAFSGGVLIPTGNVVFVPFNSSNVGMFDPVSLTYSNLVSVGTATAKYSGGTLLPDGRVIMAQYNASNVGILNTRTPVSVEFCRSPYFNKF